MIWYMIHASILHVYGSDSICCSKFGCRFAAMVQHLLALACRFAVMYG